MIRNIFKCNFANKIKINPYNQLNFLELADNFAKNEVEPLAAQTDAENQFPNQLWVKFGELGILGVCVESEYGGSELDYTTHTLIMEKISQYSGSIGLSYGAGSGLAIHQLMKHCTPEQKEKYLPKLCSGEHIGALAMSEPNAGSDVTSMKTRAEKSGNNYILNGNKMWITNGPDANVYVVYAKTGEKITAFIIERDFPGFSRGQKLNKMGMRGSNTCELIFENCVVPQENVLGELNKGVRVLMDGLDYERLILSGGPVGIMQQAFNVSAQYCKEREQFNKKIGDFQIMQGKLADMYTKLQSSRSMLYSLTRQVDEQQEISNVDSAAVILKTSTDCTDVCLEAIQILGGNGYTKDYPVERMLRDAKLYEIGAGTNEIRRWLIGREIQASYEV